MTSAIRENRYSARKILPHLPVLALLGVFLVLITRRAWVGDDGYITFRTVDNLIHGYGLTWNVGERVQAYTHPLWMFLLSAFYFVTREIFFTSIFVSLVVSLAAAGIFALRIARSRMGALLGVLILSLSNAYVDYSTSGLENPLTHLLLAVFFWLYFTGTPSPRRLFWLTLVTALAGVNRMDALALFAPAMLLSLWELPQRKQGIFAALLGAAPLLLWLAFSLMYYGFPFPNTAYAKLNTSVPGSELAVQGLNYFLFTLEHDPLTLVVIMAGLLLPVLFRDRRGMAVAFGMLLYLLYIVKIGGDFMGGRFFSALLFCAVALIGRARLPDKLPVKAALFAAVLVLGLAAPLPSYRVDIPASYPVSDEKRINDERAWYFADVSLIGRTREVPYPTSQGREAGLAARVEGEKDYYVVPVNNIGLYGYYAGPKVYIIDTYALADPLLARLPAKREANLYIGHFQRVIPRGYLSTLYSGNNLIEDEKLARYYDALRLATRGPLFSPERWRAIWQLNTRQLDDLVDFDAYRYPDMVFTTPDALAQSQPLAFADSGIEVSLGADAQPQSLELALAGNGKYQIAYLLDGRVLAQAQVIAVDGRLSVNTPAAALEQGFDAVRIFPMRGAASAAHRLIALSAK